MTRKILVVVAHADDEVLGCGGVISRHIAEGSDVQVVFMADGVTSRSDANSRDLLQREDAASEAKKVLGYSNAYFLGYADNRLDQVPMLDVVKSLEKIVKEVKPSLVYTHYFGDLNVDHRITCQAVLTACRPIPECSVREILAFEVMSSTDWGSCGVTSFAPNVFVDIDQFWGQKLLALIAYKQEMRDPPHSRSIEHLDLLSKHRGACIGMKRAEAFMLIRRLV